jgi:hypothetical protein
VPPIGVAQYCDAAEQIALQKATIKRPWMLVRNARLWDCSLVEVVVFRGESGTTTIA